MRRKAQDLREQYKKDLQYFDNLVQPIMPKLDELSNDIQDSFEYIYETAQILEDYGKEVPDGIEEVDPLFDEIMSRDSMGKEITDEEAAYIYDQAGLVDSNLHDLKYGLSDIRDTLQEVRHSYNNLMDMIAQIKKHT
jgi:hypothetical protein